MILGCSYNHLRFTLLGRRQDPKLLAGYREISEIMKQPNPYSLEFQEKILGAIEDCKRGNAAMIQSANYRLARLRKIVLTMQKSNQELKEMTAEASTQQAGQ